MQPNSLEMKVSAPIGLIPNPPPPYSPPIYCPQPYFPYPLDPPIITYSATEPNCNQVSIQQGQIQTIEPRIGADQPPLVSVHQERSLSGISYGCVLAETLFGCIFCCWPLGLVGLIYVLASDGGNKQKMLQNGHFFGTSSITCGIIIMVIFGGWR